MARHNLHCYSTDFSCTTPKAGYEKQHVETKEELDVLETWLKEIQNDPSTLIKFNVVIWLDDEDGEGEAVIGTLEAASECHASLLLKERIRNGKYPKGTWLDYIHNGKNISLDTLGRIA